MGTNERRARAPTLYLDTCQVSSKVRHAKLVAVVPFSNSAEVGCLPNALAYIAALLSARSDMYVVVLMAPSVKYDAAVAEAQTIRRTYCAQLCSGIKSDDVVPMPRKSACRKQFDGGRKRKRKDGDGDGDGGAEGDDRASKRPRRAAPTVLHRGGAV